jgi:NADPH-dependent ferric siderophore reductase
MTPSTPLADVPAKPKKPRYAVTVKSVEQTTPRMRRIIFEGEALSAFEWSGPASHIKLLFAADSPEAKPVMRTYTPRRFDPATRELTVDMVLHGEGPAASWAAQAAPGQPLTVAGPGRAYAVDVSATHWVLVGDDTAIPALATILETLPAAATADVFLEVPAFEEAAALDAVHSGARLNRLVRADGGAEPGSLLEAAVRGVAMSEGTRVYVACEAGAVRRIRRHLLQERGLSPQQAVTRGYWKLGATDHPDRDYGED